MDNPIVYVAIFSALSAIVTAFFAFLVNRRQISAEAAKTAIQADVMLIDGFKALLSEFKEERGLLTKRIMSLELDRKILERRVDQLELTLHASGLEIPTILGE